MSALAPTESVNGYTYSKRAISMTSSLVTARPCLAELSQPDLASFHGCFLVIRNKTTSSTNILKLHSARPVTPTKGF
jgi:hypothetical protein